MSANLSGRNIGGWWQEELVVAMSLTASLGETAESRTGVASLVSKLQQHLSADDRSSGRVWTLKTDSSGRVSALALHEALRSDGLDASLDDVSSLVGALESGGSREGVSLAELFGYLRSADAPPSMEERIKAAVDATALEPMPAAGAKRSGLGREMERQRDLDLARQTARALRDQMDRMGFQENRRIVAPAPGPAPSTMTGSFWKPKPYTQNTTAAAMQSALEVAEQRVRLQSLEIAALEKQMAQEEEAAGQISERRAHARAMAAAVADAAVAEVDTATTNGDSAETSVQVELARLRAQKRERGKKHADAAKRRRDGVGRGIARRPLECWRENGVAVPTATYTPQSVPAAEKKRYALEKRRFVSEKKADEARAAQVRELRHVMQGRGSSRFLECRKWVRSLGLRSFAEWLALNSSGARPGHIPADPHRCFANEGWISYEDWLGYKIHDAQLLEKVERARRDATDTIETNAPAQLKAKSPPLQSSLAVEGRASTAPDGLSGDPSKTPVTVFPHNHDGRGNCDDATYTGWYGWLEARRFATGLGEHLSSHPRRATEALAETAVWLGVRWCAGMTRSYLSQLGKASPKISAILELSPGACFIGSLQSVQLNTRLPIRLFHFRCGSVLLGVKSSAGGAAGMSAPH